jgi:hypothetical protein
MILAEEDTEKLGGYQGKIMSDSGARVMHCPPEADEPQKRAIILLSREKRGSA